MHLTVLTFGGIRITLKSCRLSRHHKWTKLERPAAASVFPSLQRNKMITYDTAHQSVLYQFKGLSVTALLCNSKCLVVDSGPILWNRQLILAKKSVAFPSKNGVVAKTAENGVAVWEKENLQQTHRNEAGD